MESGSSSIIRFQCILHRSGVPFSDYFSFYKLKREDLISGEGGGEPILQKVSLIWSPYLYFNFKSFMDQNSSSFIRFQSILHDLEFWNFCKLNLGDLISRGNQFRRKSELFGPPFCISNLKVWLTQFLRHSLDFNVFCLIR